jgi:GntP family gluconate:H+ symporter
MVWHLVFAALAIAGLILLISRFKLHPFVALLVVSLLLGIASGLPLQGVVHSFETGMGNTLGHTAIVIALGSMLGKMLAESGGAECVAHTLLDWFGAKHLAYAMLLIGLLIGLPVFFEVGFVLLMPIAFHVARRTSANIVLVALPMLAGLSIVHALIPPHPAAIAAVSVYGADLGRTIAYALLVGIPVAILAGPVYATWVAKRIPERGENPVAAEFLNTRPRASTPSFALTMMTMLLPVSLMLIGGWADRMARVGTHANDILHLFGNGDVALLCGVLVSFVTFGSMQGMGRQQILKVAGESLLPTATATLLIGAGGGFGRVLQDGGTATAIMQVAGHSHLPLVATAWLFAALLRVATGSSTVAMITAAGIVAPVALHTPGARPELLAIATGAGSIVLSHVNDGGFWLVKEYLGLSVPETFATWSACETILSVGGLVLVLVLAAV